MKDKIEKRIFESKNFRSKETEDGAIVLEGYSAVFDSPSEDLGWGDFEVREYISPGAFTEALKKSDCFALFNHNRDYVLGRESAKTLELTQDETGLRSIIHLPETTFAKDLAVSVTRGDIKGQSIGFIVAKDTWTEDRENKIATRTILEIKELLDISIVTCPAYPDTDIAQRSYKQYVDAANSETIGNEKRMVNQAEDDEFDEFQTQIVINEIERTLN